MIDNITAVGSDIALTDSFPTSYGDTLTPARVFVRVTDGDLVGYGEGAGLTSFTGETTTTMEYAVRELLAPSLEGISVDRALSVFDSQVASVPGHPGAKAGIEMALLDLVGRHRGVPLASLLGTSQRDRISIVYPCGALPAEQTATRVGEAFEAGYQIFKIKADGSVQSDIARINAVTEELDQRTTPDEARVRVDANAGWRSVETARRIIDQVEHSEFIEYYEQPVSPEAVDDLNTLRTAGIPVFADEAVHSLRDAVEVACVRRAASGVCAKLAKTGSLRDIVTMGRVLDQYQIPVTVVSAFETSLGAAANAHLAATLPRLQTGVELCTGLLEEDPVETPLPDETTISVPDGPGLGVRPHESLFDDLDT